MNRNNYDKYIYDDEDLKKDLNSAIIGKVKRNISKDKNRNKMKRFKDDNKKYK